jgi:uncharacterized protein (UPF0248 family)
MPTAKEILNELKWREDRDFSSVVVFYLHRGAPNDVMAVEGPDIESLHNSFFKTTEATIPYHRILRIEYRGEAIWKRR